MEIFNFLDSIKAPLLKSGPKYTPDYIINIIGNPAGLSLQVNSVDDLAHIKNGIVKYDSVIVNQNSPEDIYSILTILSNHIGDNGYIILDSILPIYEERNGFQGMIHFMYEHPEFVYSTLTDSDMMVLYKGFNQINKPYIDINPPQFNDVMYFFEELFNPVLSDVFLYPYQSKNSKYKYSVLTCLFNGYEIVRDPINPNPEVEYVMVTDDPDLKSDVWKMVLIDDYFRNFSGYAKTSYVKYHPFEYVNTDTVLWMDGSVLITNDFTEELMIPFIRSNAEILEFNNLVTSNCVDEMNRWNEHGFHGYTQAQYEASKSIFDNEPQYIDGQIQTTVFGCKNTKLANKINDMTYDMLMRFSEDLDVLILYMPQRSWLINKFVIGTDKIMLLNRYELFGRFFRYCDHASTVSQKGGWEECGHIINNDPEYVETATFNNRCIKLIKFGNDD